MDQGPTEEALLEEVRALAAAGNYLKALDLAQDGVEQHPDSFWLRYEYALELCRSGASARGRAWILDNFDAQERRTPKVRTLLARVGKDLAAELPAGPARAEAFGNAARHYEAVYDDDGSAYAALNAAATWCMAGEGARAAGLAEACIGNVGGDGDYYDAATLAEARLLLGDMDGAQAAFARAVDCSDADRAKLATTRRQLRLYRETGAVPAEDVGRLLDTLRVPRVAHYVGLMGRPDGGIGSLDGAATVALVEQVRETVAAERVGIAYGALAAGGDIVIAEALLDAGAELRVVLPQTPEQFRAASVTPYGGDWGERFDAALARAHSVEVMSDTHVDFDPALVRYTTEFAQGLALLHADRLCAEAVQLATWDGQLKPPASHGGTQHCLALWARLGLRNLVFGVEELPAGLADTPVPEDGAFAQRAILFGDVKGFSKLTEQQIPVFVDEVLGRFARVLEEAGEDVLFSNTWGDGIFVVVRSVTAGARIALSLQATLAALDADAVGLPAESGLRLGGHFGPVLAAEDPVLRRTNYFGVHVSRAARIEPIAALGEFYVTRAFAAQLALENARGFRAEYVGVVSAAKSYGELPMYLVKERGQPLAADAVGGPGV